jgi:hypothetical protein
MADTPIQDRRFTDREVREILKRAVERAPSRALVKSEGLSLAELQSIGQEVGIDPDRLEDAARSLILTGENRPNRILGGPTVLTFDRKVQGEISPEDTPEVLSLIRRTMGQQGGVDEIHGSLEWSTTGEAGEKFVTISSREGTTSITGSANLTQAAVLTYLPAGIFGVVTAVIGSITAASNGSYVGFAICLTVLPVLYAVLRTIFGKVADKESQRLQHVVAELARLVERPAELSPPTGGSGEDE